MTSPGVPPLTGEQVREFRDALAAALGDDTRRHKIAVLPRVTPPPAGPLDAVSDLCLMSAEGRDG